MRSPAPAPNLLSAVILWWEIGKVTERWKINLQTVGFDRTLAALRSLSIPVTSAFCWVGQSMNRIAGVFASCQESLLHRNVIPSPL
jgi:hypothetical protein